MEITEEPNLVMEEAEPELLKMISSSQIVGFDSIESTPQTSKQDQQTVFDQETEANVGNEWNNTNPPSETEGNQYVSISMPSTPFKSQYTSTPKKVLFIDNHQVISEDTKPSDENTTQTKYYSQPMPRSVTNAEASNSPQNLRQQQRTTSRADRPKDNRYDNFKTWSGRLERLSTFRKKPVSVEPEQESRPAGNMETNDALPVDRYFDALHGPELDRLRPSEELMLPEDRRWPFLLRFQISSFGICLGVSSQAILWKTLSTTTSKKYLQTTKIFNLVLWFISIALMLVVTSIYTLKLIFYFEAVRREYYHPIRVNFFFAPFISLLFLALGIPPMLTEKTLPQPVWYVLMVPFLCLQLKIYGQWMSGGQRRLSKVANPSNHLSVVGNFVGALLGATMGLKEGPIFFFAVGLAHYSVLFVTLYQRLPTNETLPKELHPVFFLFVAAPSVASMAWAKIQGSFDNGARIAYFIAIFLYFSLAVRINFFRGFRFSLAWWAYTFPMTGAAIATIRYSSEVKNGFTRALAIILCVVSMLTVSGLLVTTLLHAFVFRKLFPNDIAIAISDRPAKPRRKWFHLRHGSSNTKEIENYLKFINPDGKDTESSVEDPARNSHSS